MESHDFKLCRIFGYLFGWKGNIHVKYSFSYRLDPNNQIPYSFGIKRIWIIQTLFVYTKRNYNSYFFDP